MLNNEYPPLGGGTATVNEAILKQFSTDEDIEIDLITASIGKYEEFEQISENIRIFKLPVRNQNIHHSSNRELLEYTVRALYKSYFLTRKNKYDVCMAWCTIPAGFIALILKILRGIPYVIRISGPELPGYEKRYSLIVKFLLPLFILIWRLSSKVITKCSYEKDLVSKYTQMRRIEIIPNGVDTSRFKPKLRNNDSNDLRILSVARLIQRKRHDILIEAIGGLDDSVNTTISIIGDGDEKEKLTKLVNDYDLTNKVDFNYFVPRSEMPRFYSNADLFILVSEHEAMPNVVLEAIASGLPVISSDTGGVDQLVETGINGIILNTNDSSELAQAITKIAKSKKLQSSMGKESRKLSLKHSWEHVVSKLKRLLASA